MPVNVERRKGWLAVVEWGRVREPYGDPGDPPPDVPMWRDAWNELRIPRGGLLGFLPGFRGWEHELVHGPVTAMVPVAGAAMPVPVKPREARIYAVRYGVEPAPGGLPRSLRDLVGAVQATAEPYDEGGHNARVTILNDWMAELVARGLVEFRFDGRDVEVGPVGPRG